MPFLQRVIEPENVCRNTLPVDEQGASVSVGVSNELECITNGTLANIIRQLSSLSKHAEDMFSSLFHDSSLIISRTNSLQSRIDRLAVKATHLDSTAEEVSLQDIHMRKAFKSFILYEQQVVSRVSLPAAIREIYKHCDKPPPLDKLNPYREDGKQGLKFYTDPNYFFDLWRQEMLKDTGRVVHDRGKKAAIICKKHKRNRQGLMVKEQVDQSVSSKESEDSSYYSEQCDRVADKLYQDYDGLPIRPNSLELHPAYFPPQQTPQFDSALPQPLLHAVQSENMDSQLSSTRFYRPPTSKHSELQKATALNKRSSLKNSNRSLPPVQQPVPPAPPVPDSPASSSGSSTPTISGKSSSSSVGKSKPGGAHSRENLPPPPPPPPTSVVISNQNPISDCEDMLRAVLSASFSAQLTNNKKEPVQSETIEEEDELIEKVTNLLNGDESNDAKEKTPVADEANSSPRQQSPVTLTENSQPAVTNLVNHNTAPSQPPPPPPPLPSLDGLVIQTSKVDSAIDSQDAELFSITSGSASETSSVSKFSESADVKSKGSPHTDARSDLLAAIREGIKLRRVEGIKQKEVEKAAPLHDVASILARRVAMEFSDSESPPESEYDSDGWGDEKESTKAN